MRNCGRKSKGLQQNVVKYTTTYVVKRKRKKGKKKIYIYIGHV